MTQSFFVSFVAFTVIAVIVLVDLGESLECYEGRQRWDPEPVINNVSLVTCGMNDRCCYMVSSLDGSEFGCYSDCPRDNFFSCGPDPKSGIQDLHYCYCKSHMDANCRPYLGTPQRV